METLAAFWLPVQCFVQQPQSTESFQRVGARWRAGSETLSQPDSGSDTHKKDGSSSILLPPDLYRARFCHLLWSHSKSKGEQEFRHFLAVERRSKHLSHLDLKEVLGEILASVSLILVFTCPPNFFFYNFFFYLKNVHMFMFFPPNISSIRWPLSLFSFGRPAAGRKTRWDVSQRLKPRCHGDNSGRDLCHPVFWLQWITVHSATSSWRRFVSIWAVSRWSVFHSDAKKKKKPSPNHTRDRCRNAVMSLYPSFYWLCVCLVTLRLLISIH